jgi:AGCS family alanine or glycine:cation symporter
MVYKLLFLAFTWAGAVFTANSVVDFGDLMILGMAFPNIAGVLILTPRLKRELDKYIEKLRAGRFTRYDH